MPIVENQMRRENQSRSMGRKRAGRAKTPHSSVLKTSKPEQTPRHARCSNIFRAQSLRQALMRDGKLAVATRSENGLRIMYFAVMVLVALLVVAAVLVLEHLGDPKTLEREYGLQRPSFKDKKR